MSRSATKYLLDVTVWGLIAPVAYALRLEGGVAGHVGELVVYTAAGFAVKAAAVGLFGLHRRSWRWVTVGDLLVLATAVTFGTAALLIGVLLAPGVFVPRSVPLIGGALALLALGGMRVATRLWYERDRTRTAAGEGRRVLVVGAGNAGAMTVRELLRHPEAGMVPVGFLDDDPLKVGMTVQGVPVLGSLADLDRLVRTHHVQRVLLTAPRMPAARRAQVAEACAALGLACDTFAVTITPVPTAPTGPAAVPAGGTGDGHPVLVPPPSLAGGA